MTCNQASVAPRRRNTSTPHPEDVKYPYLLRDLDIVRANQAWCSDITYVPLPGGFAYLCAVMDWHSRKVLAWEISNTMDTDFCLRALCCALEHCGRPEIFNTDQCSQFANKEAILYNLYNGSECPNRGTAS